MALNRYALVASSRTQTSILWYNQPISIHSGSIFGAGKGEDAGDTAGIRKKSTGSPVDTTKGREPRVDPSIAVEQAGRIGFFKKLKYRFQGIPLPDELHAPVSFMRDIGKQFIPPPLPEIRKDFKEYPERDLVNYPYPAKSMYAPKLRLMVIPEKFMSAFHSYTGTSGPYVFFAMLYAFLHSKGLFEIAHDRVKVVIILFYYYIFSRAFDYRWDKYFYENRKKFEKKYLDIIDNKFKTVREVQETAKADKNAYAAIKEQFPAVFKENLTLQLEATYRKNVERLATEMKRRLDYLQETESVKRSFALAHMLTWIIDSVRSEISVNKDNIKDKYMDSCIEQLKSVSL